MCDSCELYNLVRQNNEMLKYLISFVHNDAKGQYAKDFIINYLANIAADMK